jgi:hypothetical protein
MKLVDGLSRLQVGSSKHLESKPTNHWALDDFDDFVQILAGSGIS